VADESLGAGISQLGSQQRRALAYLRNEARQAHRDGDGFLVNHTCAIALANCSKWSSERAESLDIAETYWAIALAAYWLADGYMLSVLKEVEDKSRPTDSDAQELSSLVKCLLGLLDSPLSQDVEVDGLREPHFRWLRDDSAVESSALLCLLIEFLWLRGRADNAWQEIGDYWSERAPDAVRSNLKKLMRRLESQRPLVDPESDASVEHTRPGEPSEARRHDLWQNMLVGDWDRFDKSMRALAADEPFGSPVAQALYELEMKFPEPIYGGVLVPEIALEAGPPSKRRMEAPTQNAPQERTDAGEKGKPRKAPGLDRRFGDARVVGITRWQSHVYSGRAYAFDRVRFDTCCRQLEYLWRHGSEAISESQRSSCVRLALLSELSALRRWDVSSWLDSVGLQASVCLEAARHDDPAHLWSSNAMRLSVLGLSVGQRDTLVTKTALALDKAPEEVRARVARMLAKTRPIEWYGAMTVLEWMSDAIPEHVLPEIAQWSVRVAEFPHNRLRGWKLFPLEFWGYILGRTQNTEKLCEILHPAMQRYASSPLVWSSDKQGALRKYLQNAPLPLAGETIDDMFKLASLDDSDDSRRWGLAYEACMNRSDLRDRFKEALFSTARTPLEKYYARFVRDPDIPEGPVDDDELRSWCRQELMSQASVVTDRKEASPIPFGGGLNHRVLRLVVWRASDADIIDKLVQGAEDSRAYDHEASRFIHYLAGLSWNDSAEFAERLSGILVRWLEHPPQPRVFMPRFRGKSETAAERESNPDVLYALSHLGVRLVSKCAQNVQDRLAEWASANVLQVPPHALGLGLFIAARIGLGLDGAGGVSVVETAVAYLNRAVNLLLQDETEALQQCLRVLADITSPGIRDWTIDDATNHEAKSVLVRAFTRTILQSYRSSDPQVRLQCARVLGNLESEGATPAQLSTCAKELRNDARARVRSAFRA